MIKPILYIIGGKSTSFEIFEVAKSHYKNFNICNVISDNDEPEGFENYIRDKELEFLKPSIGDRYIIGFSNFELKKRFVKVFNELNIFAINIVHPKSTISESAVLGVGNYIAANAIISANASLSNHCIINYQVVIGHDAIVGDYCVCNPGSKISGNVKIGDSCLIGANSFVFQGKEIGDNCLVDAMTYIDKDIQSNSMCTSKQALKIYKRIK